jgi:hypothetical protein
MEENIFSRLFLSSDDRKAEISAHVTIDLCSMEEFPNIKRCKMKTFARKFRENSETNAQQLFSRLYVLNILHMSNFDTPTQVHTHTHT